MLVGTKRALRGVGRNYLYKIRGVEPSNLVGVWLQNEQSGAVSYDLSGHAHNGAYTTATLGQPGVPGMRMPAASYDGTNDYNDIHSAGLANDNLLSNPGFETADGGAPVWDSWDDTVGSGALANEAGAPHEGSDAAKITAGATFNTKTSQSITTVAGKRYRLRFYSKDDGTNAGRYGIYDVSGSADIVAVTATAIAAAYAATVVEFIAPATSTRIDLWCPAVNTKIAYFDACEVRSMDGFLGDEGTLLAWAKVSAAGVWEDATARYIADIRVDADNVVSIARSTTNNRISTQYSAGNVDEFVAVNSLSSIDWMCWCVTWSKSGNTTITYLGGAAQGAAQAPAGTWLGDLSVTQVCIGALSTTPASVWSGPIGPVALWNKALSATQIAILSKV